MGYLKATYNVTSTTTPTKLANFASGYTDVLVDGVSQGKIKEYTFSTTGIHTAWFEYEIDKISDNTFINCTELIDINIPDNIITIGYGAFQGCSNLDMVSHYNSIAIISPYAFAGCKLGYGFNLWVQNDIEYDSWSTVPNRFPNKVMFIENNVFEGCYFKTFALPDTVESIHSYAFANCPNLHTIHIGSGVTSIEDNAFSSCSALTTVVCYSPTAPELDTHTFLDLNNYDGTLYYPVGSDYSSWMSANEYYLGYWDWDSVATNNIPNPDTGGGNTEPDVPDNPDTGTTTSNNLICTYNITSTESFGICYSTTGFTDILLNGTSIGLVTGYEFPSTGEYTLEFVLKDKTKIGVDAFYFCYGLTSVVIPDSVTEIGYGAFSNCRSLTGELIIPDSVTTIDKYAFSNCRSLTGELIIPDSVTTIDKMAFYQCSGLTSVVIPNSVTSIDWAVFYGCEGLTGELVIPNSVTSIEQGAFEGCSGLTSVVIGSGVTTIGDSAFRGCEGLTSITSYATTQPMLSYNTFWDLNNYDGTLYYPVGSDYSSWLSANEYYLGFWDWNSAYIGDEPTEPDTGTTTSNNLICTYNVTSRGDVVLCHNTSGFTDVLLDGVSIFDELRQLTQNGDINVGGYAYTFAKTGEYTIEFVLKDKTKIYDMSFYTDGYAPLISVVIPDTVTTIGNNAFAYSGILSSVTIPNSVTTIGENAFHFCSSLYTITIPSSVTTIGKSAFCQTGLYSITSLAPTAPTIDFATFYESKRNGTLYYPVGSDYSSWLSTDEYYLGYYGWNGIVPDNPDTGTTEVVGNINPFTTSLTVEYNVGSSSVRVGYKNIMNIHTPTSNVDWITVGTPTKLSGTFVGYDAVYQYPITISNNSGTYNRNGVITFTGYDTNGNLISSVTNVLQNAYVKPDEPDEPDIPSQSGETYSPLWKDIFYTFTSDVNDYEIYKGNTLIFKGRAYLPPNANSLKLMVNKICQNYFTDNCLDFDVDTISSSYNTFYLKNGNGVTLHTYHFINDWSYKELKLGVKTNPIIPVVVDGQKLFFSALAVNSTYFPYSVRYDGTSYSNNEYIQNDFRTVIMPERMSKNIQSFTVSGTTYNSIPKCRCQYVLYYSNPYGGFDWFPVLGKVSKTDSVVQYTYTNNYDNTTIEFGKYRYLTEISTKYQLNTGFLTEQQSSRMWELMESNCVYLHNIVEDKIYPVLITDTEIEHKKKERGRKMLSYTINVETSQTRERL